MRYALIAALAAVGTAAVIIALAQPPTGSPTAGAADRLLMPIDWAEVQAAVRSQRLPRAAIKQLTLAPDAPQPSLPMLLPANQEIAVNAVVRVFPKAHSYSASMRMPEITIEVHGDRRAMKVRDGDPLIRAMQSKNVGRLAGADVPYALDKTEGGFDLTFSRFGAAYLVSIECYNPEKDERCTKPAFIRSLGEKMSLVGKDSP